MNYFLKGMFVEERKSLRGLNIKEKGMKGGQV
jgi:hypothetical protein